MLGYLTHKGVGMNKQRREFIRQAADRVRAEYEVQIPVKLLNLCQKIGIQVIDEELDSNISGQIFYKEKKIIIHKKDSINRQRFSVAHELGHFFLHNDGKTHTSYRSSFTDDKEIEANYFAACLLMPRSEVIELYNLLQPQDMADYFGVSLEAMRIRLDHFKVVR